MQGKSIPSNNAAPTSAAIIVVQDGLVLTGRRADNGLICGPGGHIEQGETPEKAARREAMEEFRIFPGEITPLCTLPGLAPEYGTPAIFVCADFLGTPVADGKEMTGAKFVDARSLSEQELFVPFAESLWTLQNIVLTSCGSDGNVLNTNDGYSNADHPRDKDGKFAENPVKGPNGKIINKQHNVDDFTNLKSGNSNNTERTETGDFEGKGKERRHIKKHMKAMGITSEREYIKTGVEFLSKPLGEKMEEMILPNGKRYRYDYSTNEFGVANNRGNMSTYYCLDDGYLQWENEVKTNGRKIK